MGEAPGMKYCKADELIGGRCAGNQGSWSRESEEKECHAHTTHTGGKWETRGNIRENNGIFLLSPFKDIIF